MPVPARPGRPPLANEAEARQRRGLLAKVHIARKEMGLNAGEYEMILLSFRVSTSADLTIPQLEDLVRLMRRYGWKPARRRRGDGDDGRLAALRGRVLEEARGVPGWERRLPGLVKRVCGVSTLSWVHSAAKLERLLAVLAKIKEERS